mgnify:CR=1 FL=1
MQAIARVNRVFKDKEGGLICRLRLALHLPQSRYEGVYQA